MKIHMLFWDIDFEGILESFWECFGRAKSLIFAFVSMQNSDCNLEEQKIEKKKHKPTDFRFLAPGRRCLPPPWGKKQIGAQEPDKELEPAI